MKRVFSLIAVIAVMFLFTGNSEAGKLKGTVKIDGSSTVYPISTAVAEEFGKIHPRVRVTVGLSGTGGGFKKFMVGETDISDASRPVKEKEIKKGKKHGISFIELPVAYDGISIVANKSLTFLDYITPAELKKIWEPGSKVNNWHQVRSSWPNKPLVLYGPGTDSGTFDYFTGKINGEEQACRSDYTASANPNILVQGIAGDKSGFGFFGFAYYLNNKDKLRLVPVKVGNNKPVAPSFKTINNGSYKPLSRPIFIYVKPESAKRPEVDAFVKFYLDHDGELGQEAGYVALPKGFSDSVKKRYRNRVTGSALTGHNNGGKTLPEIYK